MSEISYSKLRPITPSERKHITSERKHIASERKQKVPSEYIPYSLYPKFKDFLQRRLVESQISWIERLTSLAEIIIVRAMPSLISIAIETQNVSEPFNNAMKCSLQSFRDASLDLVEKYAPKDIREVLEELNGELLMTAIHINDLYGHTPVARIFYYTQKLAISWYQLSIMLSLIDKMLNVSSLSTLSSSSLSTLSSSSLSTSTSSSSSSTSSSSTTPSRSSTLASKTMNLRNKLAENIENFKNCSLSGIQMARKILPDLPIFYV